MKYLKYFEQDSDYQSYMNGEGEVFLPNVSYVVGNNFVYFNTTKGKLEIYYKFDETNVSSFPYQMPIDITRFKSFKVDGVEYISQLEGGSSKTIEINDMITYNGDATVFTPYLDNALGNGVYSSIKVTVPNFNAETEEIFLVMYTSMDGETMAQCTPLISQGILTSVGDGEYEMIPEMVKYVNTLFEQYTASGLDVKIFLLGVESGYSKNSFVNKPTVAEYNAIKRVSYEISEPCEITAEVEWADNVNENGFFMGCFADNLQLSGFNDNLFKEVKFNNGISSMFNGCGSLTAVGDLSGWDVSNVTNMGYMFSDCYSLTSLDSISNWDTSNVTNMTGMFSRCTSLTSLDLTNWDTSKVTDMTDMFYGCRSLIEVRMGGNPSKVTIVSYMFDEITTTGTFYYNSLYDYSKIIERLPGRWTAVPCTMVDGVLVPNE